MIYYGWAGWGPYHDFYGTVWFLAGFIFATLLALVVPWVSKYQINVGRKTVFMYAVLLILFSGLLGGYYSWFASQKVALETCSHLKVHFD